MSRRDKKFPVSVTACDSDCKESQRAARSSKQIFSRFPYDSRELHANLIIFIATRCDSLELLAIIWKPAKNLFVEGR